MLNGRNVLIVEAEFLIALDIQLMLEGLDVGQCLLANNAVEARKMEPLWHDLALAVIEIKGTDPDALRLAEALQATRRPIVFITSHIHLASDMAGGTWPVVVKPASEQALTSAIVKALAIQP